MKIELCYRWGYKIGSSVQKDIYMYSSDLFPSSERKPTTAFQELCKKTLKHEKYPTEKFLIFVGPKEGLDSQNVVT